MYDKNSSIDCLISEYLLIDYMAKFYDIYHQIPSPTQRRSSLNEQMSDFESNNLSCRDCIGNCCTFTSNSMKISPIEALDILEYLKETDGFDLENLVKKLQATINEFRLNRNAGLRKTYTCPFYTGEKKGCTISKHSKPFGCLAFLPNKENIIEGKSCSSKINSLKDRDEKFKTDEQLVNEAIKNELGLNWNKLSIPEAVLDLIKKGEHLLSHDS